MQLASGVVDRELPMDGGTLLVAGGFPGSDLGHQGVAVPDAAAQALAGQQRELQLGHIEPTAVDRGVVKLQLSQDASGLVGCERLVEGRRGMGVQVIKDDPDGGRVREVAVDEVAHLLGEVVLGALVRDVNMSPGPERLGDQEEIGGSLALVLVVDALGLARGIRVSAISCLLVSSKQTAGRAGSYGSAYRSRTSSIRQTKSGPTDGMTHSFFSHGLSLFF